jgi:hypothetical protein
MEHEIYAKRIQNYFANGEPGIEIGLFRHKVVLTKEEANNLHKNILVALWGLYIPENGGEND